MNRFLLALIMVVSLVTTSGAASDPAVNPEADTTLQQPSDINTDVDSAASPIEARSDLGQRIRTEVLESITRAFHLTYSKNRIPGIQNSPQVRLRK